MRTGKDGYNRVNKHHKNNHKSSTGHQIQLTQFLKLLSLIGQPLTKFLISSLKSLTHLSSKFDYLVTNWHQIYLPQKLTPPLLLHKQFRRKKLLQLAKNNLDPKPTKTKKPIKTPSGSANNPFSALLSSFVILAVPFRSPKMRRRVIKLISKSFSNSHHKLTHQYKHHHKQIRLHLKQFNKTLNKPIHLFPPTKKSQPSTKHQHQKRSHKILSDSVPFSVSVIKLPYGMLSKTRIKFPNLLRLRYIIPTFLIIITATSSYLFYQEIIKDLPSPTQLATHTPILSTKIFDRGGNLLYEIYNGENRSLVNLDQVPLDLKHATIAIEDQSFYQHSGISPKGILRAIKANTTGGQLQGGSTLTQQVIKNTLLTPERTLTRKLKEVIVSVLTEFYFTKDEILTMYFNQIPYGGASYGVQAASHMYFDKNVTDLTLAESAFLAGLPAAPTHLSPFGPFPELSRKRQLSVLRRMVEDGYITRAQAINAAKQKLTLRPQRNTIKAPHFVMYVKNHLVNKYGLKLVEQGGLSVITSLDLDLQNTTQQIVSGEVASLTNLSVTNGAALITTPNTGEVLAMVGSIDYFDSAKDGQVNVTLRPRQPGSSIKPINYALALESSFTPATIIPDTPVCYRIQGQPDYCPKNYDGKYHGKVTLRSALANSYNVPAVKTLYQFGVKNMIQKGQDLGITTWDDTTRFGLSLTLGGGEVTMADMAVVYGALANQGLRTDLNPILKITDSSGETIEENCHHSSTSVCPSTRALDPRVAYQITDILSDNNARARAFGTNSVLNIKNHQVAVKTGTTNSLRDNWTIGYTKNFLVAAWVGNNDNTPMSYIASGITGASPIWSKLTNHLLANQPPHDFSPPDNLAKIKICTLTGTLACNGCPSKEEYFIPGTQPTRHCSAQQIANILNPPPPDPKPEDN